MEHRESQTGLLSSVTVGKPFRCELLFLGILFVMSCSLLIADDEVVPTAYDFDRYALILETCPFAKASVAEAVTQGPGFTDGWVITGHFRIGEVIFVNILDTKSQKRLTITSEKAADGVPMVVALSSEQDPIAVQAVIQQGGRTECVRFDRSMGVSKTPAVLAATQSTQLEGGERNRISRVSQEGLQELAASQSQSLRRVRYQSLAEDVVSE